MPNSYFCTLAGKHGHIAPNRGNLCIRKLNGETYLNLKSGEVKNFIQKEEKDVNNLMGAKQQCIDLIHANLEDTSVFLTLTTQTCYTEKDRQRYFYFMKMFCRTKVFKECFGNKFLYTVEKQKRGALHSHFICFKPLTNFLPYRTLIAAWRKIIGGLGSVKIIKIDDPENIGRYLAKYILKEFASVEKYKRVFVPSHSLKKPEKSRMSYLRFQKFYKENEAKIKVKKRKIDGEEIIVGYYW